MYAEGALKEMVIVIENETQDLSSNLGQLYLCFTLC